MELARELTAFVSPTEGDRWKPIVQQLARFYAIAWTADEGREILGYVYHMLRDRPDFFVNVRHQETFIGNVANFSQTLSTTVLPLRESLVRSLSVNPIYEY